MNSADSQVKKTLTVRTDLDPLLVRVSIARFGKATDSETKTNTSLIIDDLLDFLKKVYPNNKGPISRATILGWAENGRIMRRGSFEFLRGYLVRKEHDGEIKDPSAFAECLAVCSAHLSGETEKTDHPSRPKDWNGDEITWQTALALEGVYQIIRPSARRDAQGRQAFSAGEEYVLEILAFIPRAVASERVLMLSHKAPQMEKMYRGDISQSSYAMLSHLERPHSNVQFRKSFRTIAMCLKDTKHCECFSGMMLRSTSDDRQAGKRVMSSPFIAFRSLYPTDFMKSGPLEELSSEMNCMGSLLVGHLEDNRSSNFPLLKVCEKLFDGIFQSFQFGIKKDKPTKASQLIRATAVDEVDIRDQIQAVLGKNYFANWRALVDDLVSSERSG